jgi:hypothetical protein
MKTYYSEKEFIDLVGDFRHYGSVVIKAEHYAEAMRREYIHSDYILGYFELDKRFFGGKRYSLTEKLKNKFKDIV